MDGREPACRARPLLSRLDRRGRRQADADPAGRRPVPRRRRAGRTPSGHVPLRPVRAFQSRHGLEAAIGRIATQWWQITMFPAWLIQVNTRCGSLLLNVIDSILSTLTHEAVGPVLSNDWETLLNGSHAAVLEHPQQSCARRPTHYRFHSALRLRRDMRRPCGLGASVARSADRLSISLWHSVLRRLAVSLVRRNWRRAGSAGPRRSRRGPFYTTAARGLVGHGIRPEDRLGTVYRRRHRHRLDWRCDEIGATIGRGQPARRKGLQQPRRAIEGARRSGAGRDRDA